MIGSGVEAYQTSYHEHSWMKQLDLKIEDGFEDMSGDTTADTPGYTPCPDLPVTHWVNTLWPPLEPYIETLLGKNKMIFNPKTDSVNLMLGFSGDMLAVKAQ